MKDLKIFIRIKNNLILQAIEERWGKGKTLRAVAEMLRICEPTLSGYLSFRISPITNSNLHGSRRVEGTEMFYWKKSAIKIVEGLNKDPEEIFPDQLREARKSSFELEIESAKLLLEFEKPQLDLDEHINQIELKGALEEVFKRLNPIERRVLKERFGFEDSHSQNLEEIAEELFLSRERIRQIEQRALEKLRHPKMAKYLRKFA